MDSGTFQVLVKKAFEGSDETYGYRRVHAQQAGPITDLVRRGSPPSRRDGKRWKILSILRASAVDVDSVPGDTVVLRLISALIVVEHGSRRPICSA